MDTIFTNSKNSETSNPPRLLLNLSNKINLKRSEKYCFIKPLHLLYIEKYKKLIQK